jgi:hypothetical protein
MTGNHETGTVNSSQNQPCHSAARCSIIIKDLCERFGKLGSDGILAFSLLPMERFGKLGSDGILAFSLLPMGKILLREIFEAFNAWSK